MANVVLSAPDQVQTQNCTDVELPSKKVFPAEPVEQKPLPDGGFYFEAEDMQGPWERSTEKYPGFQGTAYCASQYALGSAEPTPLKGLVEIEDAGEYTVSIRALKGGAHQDRALAVEIGDTRLETTHVGEGPAQGEYTWEEAGTVTLPAGTAEITIHPVGKRHPTADAVKVTPATE